MIWTIPNYPTKLFKAIKNTIMAPKAKKTMNDMLLAKGFDPMNERVGTVLDVDGKEYIVMETKGKRYFEEYVPDSDDELVEEDYEEEKEPEKLDDEWAEADPKPVKVKKADPPVVKKTKEEPKEDEEANEPDEPDEPKKVGKPRGRKPKNPDKPKRTRPPTEYNKFVKEVMVKVIEMYPDMNNNDRMRECSKLWQKAKAEKQIAAA